MVGPKKPTSPLAPSAPAKDAKAKDPKAKAPPVALPTPESEASNRINALQESLKTLEGDVKTLEGRFLNRNPALMNQMKAENQNLKERLAKLEKALLGLLQESFNARDVDDAKTQYEVLRQSAVDYFKKANISPEIWKSIVF